MVVPESEALGVAELPGVVAATLDDGKPSDCVAEGGRATDPVGAGVAGAEAVMLDPGVVAADAVAPGIDKPEGSERPPGVVLVGVGRLGAPPAKAGVPKLLGIDGIAYADPELPLDFVAPAVPGSGELVRA